MKMSFTVLGLNECTAIGQTPAIPRVSILKKSLLQWFENKWDSNDSDPFVCVRFYIDFPRLIIDATQQPGGAA
jgi:hypothetical protein